MSLNWREISLILSELPLKGSLIQKVTQNTFHSITVDFYRPDTGRWKFYAEVGTPTSRLHGVTTARSPQQREKTQKLQRFEQFCRANVEGAKVTGWGQVPGERMVWLEYERQGAAGKIFFRLYSGAGANIIITDGSLQILDLLLRRPNRDETSGKTLDIPQGKLVDDGKFPVRERTGTSFNQQIESEYASLTGDQTVDQLRQRVEKQRDRELKALSNTVRSLQRQRDENAAFDSFRATGDLLSSSLYRVTAHQSWVTVPDWQQEGKETTISLDPKLTPAQNVEAYYAKAKRARGTWENAIAELAAATDALTHAQQKYEQALTSSGDTMRDIRTLRQVLDSGAPAQAQQTQSSPGLVITSGQFTLLVGRNAKENDELLRHHTRGNDYWMHTRDCPGGYVFIKFQRDKTVPLEVLLDAANLAIVFSKAKDAGKADLYYTQVKYLRRPKDGKTGLVLPTQEKNLSVTMDQRRLQRLLTGDAHADENQ